MEVDVFLWSLVTIAVAGSLCMFCSYAMPFLFPARATLLDQGYSVHSMAMKSLTIETVLVVWLNMVQADPVCKFRLPDFV